MGTSNNSCSTTSDCTRPTLGDLSFGDISSDSSSSEEEGDEEDERNSFQEFKLNMLDGC